MTCGARENDRAMELMKANKLRRIWRIVGQVANFSVWEADSLEELHANVGSLPLYPYMKVIVTPLIQHPVDRNAWTKAPIGAPLATVLSTRRSRRSPMNEITQTQFFGDFSRLQSRIDMLDRLRARVLRRGGRAHLPPRLAAGRERDRPAERELLRRRRRAAARTPR